VKLEMIIVFVTLVIIAGAYTVKIDDKREETPTVNKELEFNDTVFTEVNASGFLGRATTQKGIRVNGVLMLDKVRYHTNNIRLLRADTAKLDNEILYLDGHIFMDQKEGFFYEAEHANYHKRHKILTITSPFTATLNKNVIKGQSLEYDTVKKEAYATKVNGVVYTTKK